MDTGIAQHMVQPMMPEYRANPLLVKKIVQQLKTNGMFDEMRRECLADIDTKPAFQNLKQRVEGHVNGILSSQNWSPSLNKNHLRSKVRESVMQSGILNEGVDRILHQVFDAKVHSVFMPKIVDFIKEHGDDLKKEFMPVQEAPPPPTDLQMLPDQTFISSPVPVPPEVPEQQPPPPMPAQPPPPESPSQPVIGEATETHAELEMPNASVGQSSITVEDQTKDMDIENYARDVEPEDIVVKAIKTPSPRLSPEENGPVIPEDAVNPLRNLIQSLLTSKQMITPNVTCMTVVREQVGRAPIDADLRQDHEKDVQKGISAEGGFSPTIDPSQIEAFTDDESPDAGYKSKLGDVKEPSVPECHQMHDEVVPNTPKEGGSSPVSPLELETNSGPETPPSPYSPISDSHDFAKAMNSEESKGASQGLGSDLCIAHDMPSQSKQTAPASIGATYEPTERRSPDNVQEDTTPYSAPSPVSEDTNEGETDQSNHGDPDVYSEESKYDTDMRKSQVFQSENTPQHSSSSSDSKDSDSSSESSEEVEAVQEVEEVMVEEEIEEEVVEEYVSEEKSESEKSLEMKDKKKKKKSRRKKSKKARKRKRSRSGSVSSGEITSSGELSSDSSGADSRPTRPGVPVHPNVLSLQEMEDRRRVLEMEEPRSRSFWTNTESSSDYLSSPGRIRHPFSPPRRPYSPDFMRYGDERSMEMGYGPPPGPPFRDRYLFPPGHQGDFGPPMRHRFSPPPGYRRSPPPPCRFSPGPRMDYPRPPPFGSPRSPPRRLYSPPPHHMFPGDIRPGFSRPRHPHRFGSPPHPMMRRPSRSPPPHPGARIEEIPGPSKHMRF